MSITATDGVRVITISNNDQTANVVRAAEAAEASAASAADALTYAERAEAAAAETTSEGLLEAIDQAESARDDAQTYASNAATSATNAAASAETASTIADEINRIEAAATTLPAGSSATVSYDPSSSPVMTFNIPRGDQGIPGPQGDQGDPGQSFTLKATVADETALNAVPSPSENDGRIVESTNTVWIYSDSAWSDTGANIVGPAGPAGTTDYEELINVPSTFPPSAHNHDTVYVKLTGSTMSGPLAISRPSQQMITLNNTGNANANVTTIRESNAGDFAIAHGSDNTIAFLVEPAGTTITEDEAAVTKEKGDARYMRTSNYLDVDRTFATVAEMVASTKNTVGDYVRTLGYLAAGDGGGNDYQIVAAATGTVDGGSYINLTGITGQAKGLFPDGVVHVRKFGAPTSGDASAEIEAANAFAVSMKSAGDTSVTLVFEGHFQLAEPVTLGGVGRINVEALSSEWEIIAGGDLESNSDQAAINYSSDHSVFRFSFMEANHLCGGIEFDGCSGSLLQPGRIEHFAWRGFSFTGNCSGSTVLHPRGIEWSPTETEYNTSSNFVATGLYIEATDLRIIGGGMGWVGTSLHLASSSSGVEAFGYHPFNGSANYPTYKREHPVNILNEGANNFLYDLYCDNGYIDDQTGELNIDGGWHLNLTNRVTLTEPLTRIKKPTDTADITGTIQNFKTSIGFYTGTWADDFSNAVTDLVMTAGSDYGNSRVTGVSKKTTRIIPSGGPDVDTFVVRQGDGTTVIQAKYVPGTGDPVMVEYTAGRMNVYNEDDGLGVVSLKTGDMVGIAAVLDRLDFWANDTLHMTLQNNGILRPVTDGTGQLGSASHTWGAVHTVDMVASGTVSLSGVPTYADNAAALSGGLVAGEVYKTATGELRIVV